MTSERGTPVVNPRKTVVQMHAGTILSMRRSLSLHARAQQGEARDAGQRRAAAKEMEDQSPFGDDLIARPSIQLTGARAERRRERKEGVSTGRSCRSACH